MGWGFFVCFFWLLLLSLSDKGYILYFKTVTYHKLLVVMIYAHLFIGNLKFQCLLSIPFLRAAIRLISEEQYIFYQSTRNISIQEKR